MNYLSKKYQEIAWTYTEILQISVNYYGRHDGSDDAWPWGRGARAPASHPTSFVDFVASQLICDLIEIISIQ